MIIKGKEDYYKRMNITIDDVKALGADLGLSVSTNFLFLASLLVTIKMKY